MVWTPTVVELQTSGQLLWVERWNAIVSVDPTDGSKLVFTKLAYDMNGDGAVTISDARLWTEWLLTLPGDYMVIAIMKWAPSVAHFFELGPHFLGSWLLSLAVAGIAWFTLAR